MQETVVKGAAGGLIPGNLLGRRVGHDVLEESSVEESSAPVLIGKGGAGEHGAGRLLQGPVDTLGNSVALGRVGRTELLADAEASAEGLHLLAAELGCAVRVENLDLEGWVEREAGEEEVEARRNFRLACHEVDSGQPRGIVREGHGEALARECRHRKGTKDVGVDEGAGCSVARDRSSRHRCAGGLGGLAGDAEVVGRLDDVWEDCAHQIFVTVSKSLMDKLVVVVHLREGQLGGVGSEGDRLLADGGEPQEVVVHEWHRGAVVSEVPASLAAAGVHSDADWSPRLHDLASGQEVDVDAGNVEDVQEGDAAVALGGGNDKVDVTAAFSANTPTVCDEDLNGDGGADVLEVGEEVLVAGEVGGCAAVNRKVRLHERRRAEESGEGGVLLLVARPVLLGRGMARPLLRMAHLGAALGLDVAGAVAVVALHRRTRGKRGEAGVDLLAFVLGLDLLDLVGKVKDADEALVEVGAVAWCLSWAAEVHDNAGKARRQLAEDEVAEELVRKGRVRTKGDEGSTQLEELVAEGVDVVLAGPAEVADACLERALAVLDAALEARDKGGPGEEASTLGDLADDTDGFFP